MNHSPQIDAREHDNDAKCLGIFAKFWDVGTVKTRLGKDLGMAASAALHRTFVMHLASSLASVAATRSLVVAPDDRCDDFVASSFEAWQVEPQGLGSLGDRMQRFFRRSFEHSPRVVLIGSDCPTLPPARIESAFAALSRHDAVLGPAVDGGYYLIGLRDGCHEWMGSLFTEMPWSGDRVAALTRQRLCDAGATWTELPSEEDIDTIDCLRRLDQQLSAEPGSRRLTAAVRRALAAADNASRTASEQEEKMESDRKSGGWS